MSARVRASDTEREEYASVVREAVGEGRLTLGEGDERLATIYAARYRDELRPLVGDLPRPESSHEPHRGYDRRRGYDARYGLFRHASFVALVAVVLITIWAAFGTSHFFWPVIPLAFLTIGLLRHGMWMRWSRRR